MSADNAAQAQSAAQTYDVGRVSARRFAGVRMGSIFNLRNFMIVALCLSLYAQLGHTAHVAYHLSRGTDAAAEFNSYVFAVAVEVSVLILVMAKHKRISWMFAVATFLTNLAYFWIVWGGEWQSANAVFAVLMSLLLPGVIVSYSHSVVAHSGAAQNAGAAQGDGAAHQVAQNGAEAHNVAHEGAGAAQDGAGAQQVALPVVVGAQRTAQAQQGSAEQHAGAAQAQQDAQDNAQDTQDAAQDGAKMTKEQRRMHIKESGLLDAAQVVAQYGIKLRTAQEDIKAVRAELVQVNGNAAHAAQGW